MSNRRGSKPAARTSASKGARTTAGARTRSAPRHRTRPTRDFWGTEPAAAEEPTPIRPADDPTALIHSLGPPPLPNATAARHYFDAVYERAAMLAMALAASADLADTDDSV